MPPPAGEAGFTAAELSDPSSLPESVADQIQAARVRAALLGQGPAAWAVGAKCQAQYSVDGEYYDATVDGVTADGKFVVVFDGYETKEEVSARGLLPRRWASGGASWAGWAGGGGAATRRGGGRREGARDFQGVTGRGLSCGRWQRPCLGLQADRALPFMRAAMLAPHTSPPPLHAFHLLPHSSRASAPDPGIAARRPSPPPHQVALTGVRPLLGEGEGYKGVAAPKRKRVEEAPTVVEIPKVRAW